MNKFIWLFVKAVRLVASGPAGVHQQLLPPPVVPAGGAGGQGGVSRASYGPARLHRQGGGAQQPGHCNTNLDEHLPVKLNTLIYFQTPLFFTISPSLPHPGYTSTLLTLFTSLALPNCIYVS